MFRETRRFMKQVINKNHLRAIFFFFLFLIIISLYSLDAQHTSLYRFEDIFEPKPIKIELLHKKNCENILPNDCAKSAYKEAQQSALKKGINRFIDSLAEDNIKKLKLTKNEIRPHVSGTITGEPEFSDKGSDSNFLKTKISTSVEVKISDDLKQKILNNTVQNSFPNYPKTPPFFGCYASDQNLWEIKIHSEESAIAMEFVLIPTGTFHMGSPDNEVGRYVDEGPVHEVKISGFWMGKYEVTQKLWETVVGSNPSQYSYGDDYPVEKVSWKDVQNFINLLNLIDEKIKYRLPSEAEWEYAARGGHKMSDTLFSGSNDPLDVAWFIENSGSKYMKIGLKKPNELGIHDMSGNMWEWCWDWYDKDYYGKSPQLDPVGPLMMPRQELGYDPERSRRSGRWLNPREYITVSSRSADFVHYRGDNGMRLVRTITNQQE